ncbi:MAG: class I SAM-dependent methyltransferase, partial [Dokdonella sp.]
MAELDRRLAAAAVAASRSDDEFRASLSSFALDPLSVVDALPRDPSSPEYARAQMALYELIARKPYKTANEKTPFDHEHMLKWPFPYSTRSSTVVGDYLMTYGNLIKKMKLPDGARILEIGSGYGPLTWQLASMGHDVTCVDMDEALLSYVHARTRNLPGRVDTLVADMNTLSIADSFDAIIFFESFHHSADHVGLLKRLPRLLEPNGVLVFAGEPFVGEGSLAVPYPWGLRMDGLSLWCIRQHGWFESGFQDSYLHQLLKKLGWIVDHQSRGEVETMGIWIARRRVEESRFGESENLDEVARWTADHTALKTHVGIRDGNPPALRSHGDAGFLVFGPHDPLAEGSYEVQWIGRVSSASANGHVDVACDSGRSIVRRAGFALAKGTDRQSSSVLARLRFRLDEPVPDIEFRV